MSNRVFSLSLFVTLIAALGLAACAGPGAKDDDPQTQGPQLPAYFEEIPADTFFFVGGSEPVPRELVDELLSTVELFYGWSEFQGGVNPITEMGGQVRRTFGGAAYRAGSQSIFDMLSELMVEAMSADGLEELGISPSPRVAAYSVGNVPVIRFELSDPAKFSKVLDELEAAHSRNSTRLEHRGISYRRFEAPNAQRYVLLRTTETEAIVAMPDKQAFEIFVPYFVGAKKPAKSLADDNAFERTVATHGFERFGAAYFDLEQLVAYRTGAEKPEGITAEILTASDFGQAASEDCKADYMRLIQKMPRLVAGIRHHDDDTTDVAVGAELDDTLARGLAGTVSGTPGYDTAFAEKSLLHLGLGVDIGKMSEFLVEQARLVKEQPYRCEELTHLNQSASNLIARSAQIPPVISKLTGVDLVVRNILLEWDADATAYGTTIFIPRMVAALRTEQPEEFLFLVGQFAPMAQQIQVKPDGEPAPIPLWNGVYEGIIEPTMLMTQQGLAATVGPEMTEGSLEILGAKVSASSPAFISRINLGEPARETVASIRAIIDQARADKDARGLTDEHIAGAQRAVTRIEAFLPDEAWTATISAEFNERGMLFSYNDEGALDLDPAELPGSDDAEDFDALVHVLGIFTEANMQQAKIQMGNLSQALDMYYTREQPHTYPERLEQLVDKRLMHQLPADPWGEPYVYRREGPKDFTLKSKGPDGVQGTADDILREAR